MSGWPRKQQCLAVRRPTTVHKTDVGYTPHKQFRLSSYTINTESIHIIYHWYCKKLMQKKSPLGTQPGRPPLGTQPGRSPLDWGPNLVTPSSTFWKVSGSTSLPKYFYQAWPGMWIHGRGRGSLDLAGRRGYASCPAT